MKSKKTELRAVRFDADDAREIERVAWRLGLTTADVIRRCVRVGIRAFEDAKLPVGAEKQAVQ